jgi:hypothetical protein
MTVEVKRRRDVCGVGIPGGSGSSHQNSTNVVKKSFTIAAMCSVQDVFTIPYSAPYALVELEEEVYG